MNRQRHGKYAELRVATELLKNNIPVYFPIVDDEKVDMIVRIQSNAQVEHYDIQVKSVVGYNRIIGVPWGYISSKPSNYLLVLAFIHPQKQDEFFFLTVEDLLKLKPKPLPEWGDLRFTREERERYSDRTIPDLVRFLTTNIPF